MKTDTTAHYCIVIKPDSGSMALIRSNDGHRLPVVHLQNPCWLPDQAANLNGDLMDMFGLNCTTLRWIEQAEDYNLVVMEWHPGSQSPETDVAWFDYADDSLPLPPAQLQMVRDWQESKSDGLVPWEQPGWMRHVVISLIRVFDGRHNPQVTNLAQFKAAWGMSTLLLIETTDGDYFFKAGTRQGVEEWRVTRFLHRKFPEYVKDPFLIDENHGWMITRGVENKGFPVGDYANLCEAFRAYAEIQLGSDDLFRSEGGAGLRVRDEDWFRRHVEDLFSSEKCPAEFQQAKSVLAEHQLAGLRETWLRQIDALAASSLPLLFSQEDFHLLNVLNTETGPVFIDWADCARAHPFFSLHRVFHLWGDKDPEISRLEKTKVKEAYLEEFRHLAAASTLQSEFDLTRQLSPLYQALRCLEISRDQNRHSPWGKHCFNRAARYMTATFSDHVDSTQDA